MKTQALFSSKDKSKKLKCCLLQFLFGLTHSPRYTESILKEGLTARKAPAVGLNVVSYKIWENFNRVGSPVS